MEQLAAATVGPKGANKWTGSDRPFWGKECRNDNTLE